MSSALLNLLIVFIKIGLIGFGGGYAMMSLIMSELDKLNISLLQFADLNALDMVVPGPIMVNAATYVGYLHAGFWGSLVATVAAALPSFLYVTLVMRFLERYRQNHLMDDLLSGIKPAAVGLIAASSMLIAAAVVFPEETAALTFSTVLPAILFAGTAFANIRFKVNPILLTLLAGVIGAFLL